MNESAVPVPFAGSNLWIQPREVEEVRRLLLPGENLLLLTNGAVLRLLRPARTWLIALTQHRLLCIRGHRTARRRLIEVPVSTIDEAHIRRDIRRRFVIIEADSGILRLGRIPPDTADALVRMINGLAHGTAEAPPPPRALRDGAAAASSEPAAPPRDERIDSLERVVERLEAELAKTQEQVDFLERLLQKRTPGLESVSTHRTGNGYGT